MTPHTTLKPPFPRFRRLRRSEALRGLVRGLPVEVGAQSQEQTP